MSIERQVAYDGPPVGQLPVHPPGHLLHHPPVDGHHVGLLQQVLQVAAVVKVLQQGLEGPWW